MHTISHSNRKDCHDLARDLLRQQTLASNLSVQQQQKLEDANQTLVHAQTLLDQETRLAAQTLMSIKHYSLHQNHQVSIQEPVSSRHIDGIIEPPIMPLNWWDMASRAYDTSYGRSKTISKWQ